MTVWTGGNQARENLVCSSRFSLFNIVCCSSVSSSPTSFSTSSSIELLIFWSSFWIKEPIVNYRHYYNRKIFTLSFLTMEIKWVLLVLEWKGEDTMEAYIGDRKWWFALYQKQYPQQPIQRIFPFQYMMISIKRHTSLNMISSIKINVLLVIVGLVWDFPWFSGLPCFFWFLLAPLFLLAPVRVSSATMLYTMPFVSLFSASLDLDLSAQTIGPWTARHWQNIGWTQTGISWYQARISTGKYDWKLQCVSHSLKYSKLVFWITFVMVNAR